MPESSFSARLQIKCEDVRDAGNGNDKVKLNGGFDDRDPDLLNSELSNTFPSVSLGLLFPADHKGPKPEAGKHYLLEMIEIEGPANDDMNDDREPDDAA